MGIENMRRWPMYIVFAVCFFLLLSLLNSWSLETELRTKLTEISTHLHECSKQQASCMEESITMMGQRDNYLAKVNDLDKQMDKLTNDISDYKDKMSSYQAKANHTLVDVELCKTELQSLKNLQLSKSATLETLRLEKDTLSTQLSEKKQRIEDLEKEIEKLKAALTTKSVPAPAYSKVTPAAQIPKQNSVLKAPIHEPVMDAREEMEDSNLVNEGNDIDINEQ